MTLKRALPFFCLVTTLSPLQAEQSGFFSRMNLNPWEYINPKGTIAVIGGAAALYYLYTQIQLEQRLENTITDATADAIYISFLPHAVLSQLPKAEQDDILRKKAHFINIRKRALDELCWIMVQNLQNESSFFSKAHLQAVRRLVLQVTVIFKTIDHVRAENPYEQEFAIPSYLDQIIEDRIVNSLILTAKPEHELSPDERKKRADMAERRSLVLEKLEGKIDNFLAGQIMSNSYILEFFG